jgi:hypothetical protein
MLMKNSNNTIGSTIYKRSWKFFRIIGPVEGGLLTRNLRYIEEVWREHTNPISTTNQLGHQNKINDPFTKERIARRDTVAFRRINDARCESGFEDHKGLEAFRCRCNKACSYGSIKRKRVLLKKCYQLTALYRHHMTMLGTRILIYNLQTYYVAIKGKCVLDK